MPRPLRVVAAGLHEFIEENGAFLMCPHNWKYMMQWFGYFDQVTLLSPRLSRQTPHRGWLPLPAHVRVVKLYDRGDSFLQRRASTFRVAAEIIKDHDLYYARLPDYVAYWCCQIAQKCGLPMLVEVIGDFETGILAEEKQYLARRLTRRLRAWWARKIVERMCAQAFCVVTTGPVLAEKYVPQNVPALPTTCNFLHREEYQDRSDFALHSPPRILFVGNVQIRKGMPVLFQALDRLHRDGRDFKMILVGTGPQKAVMLDYARRRGFEGKVEFIGGLPHGEELFNQYKSADLFVLPSIAVEGVPRVTHEAMAFGCPVVATDVGSIAWQLRDGAGIVVPPNDAEALAEAIVTVLEDGNLREQLSKKGFERSLSHTFEIQKQETHDFVMKQLDRIGL